MPIYVYEESVEEQESGLLRVRTFEALEPVCAEPMTVHPVTGNPVRRIVAPVAILNSDLVHDGKSKAEERQYYNNWYDGYMRKQESLASQGEGQS